MAFEVSCQAAPTQGLCPSALSTPSASIQDQKKRLDGKVLVAQVAMSCTT